MFSPVHLAMIDCSSRVVEDHAFGHKHNIASTSKKRISDQSRYLLLSKTSNGAVANTKIYALIGAHWWKRMCRSPAGATGPVEWPTAVMAVGHLKWGHPWPEMILDLFGCGSFSCLLLTAKHSKQMKVFTATFNIPTNWGIFVSTEKIIFTCN